MGGRSGHGKSPVGGKAPSQRQLRVGEELRHAIVRVLERGDLRDPVIANATITVTEVRVSPDLKNATAYVVPLGGANAEPIVAALEKARAFVRHQIASMVNLRYAPDIKFERDTSFDEAGKIDALLKSVMSDDTPDKDAG
ncbi:MAG: 30S ribosome-binding factor RbfA [Rhodospirillales bacterium]